MKCGEASQSNFRNPMDVVGHSTIVEFVNLCKKDCTEHFHHDNGRNLTGAFGKSGTSRDAFGVFVEILEKKETSYGRDSPYEVNCNA